MGSKATITPRLVIIEGKEKGKVISLENGTAVLGRSKGDVLIPDPRVSRSHVAIHFDDETGKLTFTDLKSLNGTLVNGSAQEAGELKDGDRLQLGNTLFDCQVVTSTKEPSLFASRAVSHSPEGGGINADDPIFLPQDLPREPQVMNGAAATARRKLNVLPKLRHLYLAIPRKTRLYSLCALALGFSFWYASGPSAAPITNDNVDRMFSSITELQAKGRLEEALQKAEEIKKSNPDNSRLYKLLGDLYALQGKPEDSVLAYQKALTLTPVQNVAHIKLMRLYLSTGMKKEAEAENNEVERITKEKLSNEELNAESREFFVEVGTLWLDIRELEVPPKKMIVMGQALANVIAPKETIGWKLQAVGQILQGIPEEAVRNLELARKRDPGDQSILQYLVFAKVKLNDLAGATSLVQEWMEKFPNATQPLLIVAHWKYEAKDFASAIPMLQKAAELAAKSPGDPVLPEAYFLLGKIYKEQGQMPEAENAFRIACEKGYATACDTALLSNEPAPDASVAPAPPVPEPPSAPSTNP